MTAAERFAEQLAALARSGRPFAEFAADLDRGVKRLSIPLSEVLRAMLKSPSDDAGDNT